MKPSDQYRLGSLTEQVTALLKDLIRQPSFSREEDPTATIIERFLEKQGITAMRSRNNVWAVHPGYDPAKPTLLLNSHHDTVKPNPQYTKDPFEPIVEEGRLYGLGSNDAGGPLVCLIAAFLYYYHEPLPWNLVLAATAEEEISGFNGIEALLKDPAFLASVQLEAGTDFNNWSAIVGEPTQMELAVSEKGLLVLDCIARGKAGHAAREEGINAIYLAIDDINWFRHFRFEKISETLGPVKMSVTVMQTENKAHNVVPAECSFTVDIRVTDAYTHEEILERVSAAVSCEVKPRSMRMRATGIGLQHPLVASGIALGRGYYGSPTCSDKALMPFPALKCGPGDSARSHSADEYIFLQEIAEGVRGYVELIAGAADGVAL